MDMFEPFCKSKEVENYSEVARNRSDMVLIVEADYVLSTISGYLDRKIYYPDINRFTVCCSFNDEMMRCLEEVLEDKPTHIASGYDILLVLSYELNDHRSDISTLPLAKFTNTNKTSR